MTRVRKLHDGDPFWSGAIVRCQCSWCGSMIGGPLTLYRMRHETLEQALDGHAAAIYQAGLARGAELLKAGAP